MAPSFNPLKYKSKTRAALTILIGQLTKLRYSCVYSVQLQTDPM